MTFATNTVSLSFSLHLYTDPKLPNIQNYLPLPSGLEELHLQVNNISNFNPTLALPNTIKRMYLNANSLTSFNLTTGIPSGLQYLGLVNNHISMSSWNTNTAWINSAPNNAKIIADNSIIGTTTFSLLTSKGLTITII